MSDLQPERVLARLSPGDAEATLALSRDCGWPHDLRDWRTMLELGQGVGIRDRGGRLVAAGLLFFHGSQAATVGMIIVAGEQRGRGLGRRVMAEILRQAGSARSVWLYASEQGVPLYRKLGFEEIGATLSYRGELRAPSSGGGSARSADAGDLDRVAALDRVVFGAARGALIDRLLRNEGRLCVTGGLGAVTGGPGAVTGYALIRAVGSGWQIGPVMAGDEAAAFDLITFLGGAAERPLRIDLPESAMELRRALEAAGLVPLPREPLMVRGRALPGDRRRFYAVASSAYG